MNADPDLACRGKGRSWGNCYVFSRCYLTLDVAAVNFLAAAVIFQLDIRDPAAVAAAVDQIEAKLGLPNVVIHNAAGTPVIW